MVIFKRFNYVSSINPYNFTIVSLYLNVGKIMHSIYTVWIFHIHIVKKTMFIWQSMLYFHLKCMKCE